MINNWNFLLEEDKKIVKEYLLFKIDYKFYWNKGGYFWSKPSDFYRHLKQNGSLLYNLVTNSYFVLCPSKYREVCIRLESIK